MARGIQDYGTPFSDHGATLCVIPKGAVYKEHWQLGKVPLSYYSVWDLNAKMENCDKLGWNQDFG